MQETELAKPELENKLSKYDDPELTSYVIENRNLKKTWSKIADELKDRGFESITPSKVSEIYQKAVAKSVIYHDTASEHFDDFSLELNKMYSKAITVLNKLVAKLDMLEEQIEGSDLDMDQKLNKFINVAPQIKMTADTILKYIQEHSARQDKTINTIKKEIITPGDILDTLSKHLKILEKEGKIRIIDASLRQ